MGRTKPSITKEKSRARTPCPSARSVIEVPLDTRGIYGLEYESAATRKHFLSAALTEAETDAVFSAFKEMNAMFGLHIDRHEEEILPSRFASAASAFIRSFRNHAATSTIRTAMEKILPVFEKAAVLGMPVAFYL